MFYRAMEVIFSSAIICLLAGKRKKNYLGGLTNFHEETIIFWSRSASKLGFLVVGDRRALWTREDMF